MLVTVVSKSPNFLLHTRQLAMTVTSTPAQASAVAAIELNCRVMSRLPVKPNSSRHSVSGDSSVRLEMTWATMTPSAAIQPQRPADRCQPDGDAEPGAAATTGDALQDRGPTHVSVAA